jgi:hypothetical protein
VLPLLALVLGVAAGCGSRSSGPGVATAGGGAGGGASAHPTSSADRAAQMRRFAQCMREHGVDMPDPNPNGGGVKVAASGTSKQKVSAATQACQSYLPPDVFSSPNPQQLAQLRQFAQCMRDHGVNMPDPDPNGGGLRISKSGGTSPDDPAFNAAQNACSDKLPGKGGGQ